MNIFTYGTLMSADVWSRVVAGNYTCCEAALYGYSRKQLKDREYPGLIADNSASVNGTVYFAISEQDQERLDTFEGNEYQRVFITVTDVHGKDIICETYVFNNKYQNLVLDREWSFDEYMRERHHIFIQQFCGWGKL